jgi:hypothetical protein
MKTGVALQFHLCGFGAAEAANHTANVLVIVNLFGNFRPVHNFFSGLAASFNWVIDRDFPNFRVFANFFDLFSTPLPTHWRLSGSVIGCVSENFRV